MSQEVKISVADPTALGVFGLSMVTLVASSQKLGITHGTSLIIPWAIFLGALAQWAASGYDFKKGNYFGATVLGSFGLFWFAVASSWMVTNGMFGEGMKAAANVDPMQLGFAFLGFFIFCIPITIACFEVNIPFIIILLAVDSLLGSMALSSFGLADKVVMGKVAGYSELIASLFGFYAASALFMKGFYGREILPLGKPMGLIKKAPPVPTSTTLSR